MRRGEERSKPKIESAVVLAGGEGLRLRPLTNDKPKAMIPVAGKPILDWILEWLSANEIRHIVIGVAYKKEIVREHLQHSWAGTDFDFSEHTVEGGTGEGFRLAIKRYVPDPVFLAMNGDEITNINVNEFANTHIRLGGLVTIAVSNLRSPFGIVEVNHESIVEFKEKPFLDAWVSTGVYIFDHRILGLLPLTGNIEDATFPMLARDGQLRAYRHIGFWGTINTMKDLQDVEKELMTGILTERHYGRSNQL